MAGTSTNDNYADVKTKIRAFLLSDLAKRRGVTSIGDDDSLLESGVVDSLGIFLIVTFLEENFHVGVADDEITPDNFNTLDAISRMVESKRLGQEARSGN